MNKSKAALLVCLSLAAPPSLAQGGAPLLTDDADTPGAGKWEINVVTIYERTRAGSTAVAIPDLDMNYGWGESAQLKLEVPWVYAREPGEPWKAGLGRGNAGVKWRFIDEDDAGFSMSTYPQYGWNILESSARRGITEPGHEFFLPVEVSKKVGDLGFGAEAGRNFVSQGAHQWIVGAYAASKCGEKGECLLEIHNTSAPHEHQTLVNAGLRWKLAESMTLLAAVGREFGTNTGEQRRALFYLGLQLLR